MSKKKAPRRLGQKSLRLFGYALAFALQFFLDNAVKSIGSPASFNETYSKVFLPSRFSLSSLYPYIAHTLSRHSVALNTVVVTLGKDEPINYSDNCARRRLISDALIAIGSAKPGAIGVDYNFNRFGCASAQDTEWLRRSLNQVGANVPIVLGQQSLTADDLRKQWPTRFVYLKGKGLDEMHLFIDQEVPFAVLNLTKIHVGLGQLNLDNRKIPLSWPVMSLDGQVRWRDTFSFAVAKAFGLDGE